MLMELTCKSVGVWVDFRAELTLKSVRDGLIWPGTNTQIRTSRKKITHKSTRVSSNCK